MGVNIADFFKKKIVINGKFFAQRITGVQRFAREILLELDKIADAYKIEIVVPKNARDIPELNNIKVVKSRFKKSILWEQIWLPMYIWLHNDIGVHLCHVAPIIKPDIVCLHDANILQNPQWFTRKVLLWYGLIDRVCAKFAKKILTISEFSKNDLNSALNISGRKIEVLTEGHQHLEKTPFDESALSRYNLKRKNFYFSLGTRAPHKNIKWIHKYAKAHPNEAFALSGSSYDRIFGKVDNDIPANVKFLGYLSDAEIKTLMRDCKAFVFPSFYEGFGLPPLEALSVGCPVIVSDIPVMHEIFGDAVRYIDPNNANVDLEELLTTPVTPATAVLEKYSWKRGAEMLKNVIKEIA